MTPPKSSRGQDISGTPRDRRRRWEQRMREAGFKRVGLWVPAEEKVLVQEVRELLASGNHDLIEELRQFFHASYEAYLEMALEDGEDEDAQYFKARMQALKPRGRSDGQ